MSSKAFRVVIDNVPHLINLNHVAHVTLKENALKFYFNANKGIMGFAIAGSGSVGGNDLLSFEVAAKTKEDAAKIFEDVAKLM